MQDAVEQAEPIPFLAVRFLVAAVVLVPFAHRAPPAPRVGRAGLACGAALLTGYVLQTVGLQYTTPPVSAFVTYLLVVLVPIIAAVTIRRPPRPATAAGVALATAGLFLLTGKGVALGRGEVLTLGCAFAFAVHVVLLAELAPRLDWRRLNLVQLTVVGVACAGPGLFLGGYRFPAAAWAAAAATGILASAVALGLQVWGQARVGPTRAALLLMVEPVSAGVLGQVTGDPLGAAGVAGAALILGGIAVAELPLLARHRN